MENLRQRLSSSSIDTENRLPDEPVYESPTEHETIRSVDNRGHNLALNSGTPPYLLEIFGSIKLSSTDTSEIKHAIPSLKTRHEEASSQQVLGDRDVEGPSTTKDVISDHPGHRESQKITFMTLPLEIREMIYTFAMEDSPTRLKVRPPPSKPKPKYTYHPQPPTALISYRNFHALFSRYTRGETKVVGQIFTFQPDALPDICFVSKAIWAEACLAYIRRTQFAFPGLLSYSKRELYAEPAIHDWLRQFPGDQGLKAVRKMEVNENCVNSWTCAHGSSYLSSFAGLRSVVISVDAYNLVDFHDKAMVLSSEDYVRRSMNFTGLFQVTTLMSLKVIGRTSHWLCKDLSLDDCKDVFAVYMALWYKGLAHRGGNVDIQLEVVHAEYGSDDPE